MGSGISIKVGNIRLGGRRLAAVPGTPIAAYAPTSVIRGFGGSPASNTAGIWSWADQTGNGYGLTAESSTGISFSTQSGFTFGGANSLRRAALALANNYSVYILASVPNPCKGSLLLNGGLNPETGLSFGVGGNQHQELGMTYRVLVQGRAWGAPVPISAAGLHLFRGYSKSTGQTRIGINNGLAVVSSTTVPASVTSGIFSVGGHVATGFNRYFSGSIKAVIVYNYDTETSSEDAAIRTFIMGL